MCRYWTKDRASTPVFWYQFIFDQFLFYSLNVGAFFINLIDRNNDLDSCCFRMVDRFDRLWHNTVICSYD